MPRPVNPDLTKSWKVSLPATLAGIIEFKLLDPVYNKPVYGLRGKLIENLLSHWNALEEGREPPPILTLQQLREQSGDL